MRRVVWRRVTESKGGLDFLGFEDGKMKRGKERS